MLLGAGLKEESEELYFRLKSLSLETYRSGKLESMKREDELVDDDLLIIEYCHGCLERLSQAVEDGKNKYLFKTSERCNSVRLGPWIVQETNLTISQLAACLSDEILSSQRRIGSLQKRLVIEFGNYETKGISTTFLLEEFFNG